MSEYYPGFDICLSVYSLDKRVTLQTRIGKGRYGRGEYFEKNRL